MSQLTSLPDPTSLSTPAPAQAPTTITIPRGKGQAQATAAANASKTTKTSKASAPASPSSGDGEDDEVDEDEEEDDEDEVAASSDDDESASTTNAASSSSRQPIGPTPLAGGQGAGTAPTASSVEMALFGRAIYAPGVLLGSQPAGTKIKGSITSALVMKHLATSAPISTIVKLLKARKTEAKFVKELLPDDIAALLTPEQLTSRHVMAFLMFMSMAASVADLKLAKDLGLSEVAIKHITAKQLVTPKVTKPKADTQDASSGEAAESKEEKVVDDEDAKPTKKGKAAKAKKTTKKTATKKPVGEEGVPVAKPGRGIDLVWADYINKETAGAHKAVEDKVSWHDEFIKDDPELAGGLIARRDALREQLEPLSASKERVDKVVKELLKDHRKRTREEREAGKEPKAAKDGKATQPTQKRAKKVD